MFALPAKAGGKQVSRADWPKRMRNDPQVVSFPNRLHRENESLMKTDQLQTVFHRTSFRKRQKYFNWIFAELARSLRIFWMPLVVHFAALRLQPANCPLFAR